MKLLIKIIVLLITPIVLFSCAGLESNTPLMSTETKELSNSNINRDITNVDYTTETTTYWITTDKPVSISWDTSTDPAVTSYTLVMQWIRGTKVLQTYNMGDTTTNTKSIMLPRVGTFVVGIKAVNSRGTSSEFCYSNDTTCASVNNTNKPWVIEGYLPSVGGVVIE
jgi:hypothetical protein